MSLRELFELAEDMDLKPCPFCGDPAENTDNWRIDEHRLEPRMDGKRPALICVEVRHWCGGSSRALIKVVGRDYADAASKWNRRAEKERTP